MCMAYVQTKRGIQGAAALVLVAVLAYNSPVWWADWQTHMADRQADRQAAIEFKQSHYPVTVRCKNCRKRTDLWQDKGRRIEGLEGECGACGVRMRAGLKGEYTWSEAWGYPVEGSGNSEGTGVGENGHDEMMPAVDNGN